MNIRKSGRLSTDAKTQWIAWLPDNSLGSAAIDLCEALQDSETSVSVVYVEVFSSDQRPLALGIVHTIHGLDLASYIGGVTQRIFSAVGRLGLRPLTMDVAFLELPFCNLPGLFMTAEGERLAPDVVREVVRFVRAELRCDIFCVKTSGHKPCDTALQALEMLHSPFLANTSLALPFATFEEYLKSLPQEWRSNIRRSRRKFADANGTVRWVTDLESHARQAADMFHLTTDFHAAKGHMGRPLDIGENFLRNLGRNAPAGHRLLMMCEVDGRLAATALVMRSGKALIAVKCGLHQDLARPSAAYFNFYYATIEFAIQHGLESIELCAEAYDVKRRMGGVTAPVSYYLDINNRWIAPIVRLVTKHFSGQKGAAIDTADA